MSTHNISCYEDLTKSIFQLLSNLFFYEEINTHYYLSNLICWIGSRRVAAPGTTGSHETKSSVIRSFLAQPRDVI